MSHFSGLVIIFMYILPSSLVLEGRLWDLIVLVHDHCPSFYSTWEMGILSNIKTLLMPGRIYDMDSQFDYWTWAIVSRPNSVLQTDRQIDRQ